MYEVEAPWFGYVKLDNEDLLFMLIAVGMCGWNVYVTLTSPIRLFTLGLNLAVFACGFGIVWGSLYHGRQRIEQEEWGNPVGLLEAIQCHMAAEGY